MVDQQGARQSAEIEQLKPLNGNMVAGPDLDIADCAREPIHIPGAIQPHGLLLVADATTLKTVAGAGHIEGRLNPDWLDRPLADLLGQTIAPYMDDLNQPGNALVVRRPGSVAGIAKRVGLELLSVILIDGRSI